MWSGFVSADTSLSWTAQTPPSGNWTSVTYGNGLFVAVGTGVMTSPDGINWTARTVAGTNNWSRLLTATVSLSQLVLLAQTEL